MTGPNCRRCRADLGLLFLVAAEHDYWLSLAATRLQTHDRSGAVQAADRALEFRATAAAQAVRTLAEA